MMNKPLLTLHRHFALATGVLLLLAIAVGSLMPDPPMPDAPNSDKLAHLLGYACLAGWWAISLPKRPLLVLLLASAFGIGIEFLQGQTAYRSFDPIDMLANSAGCLLGLLLAWLLRPVVQLAAYPS